MLPTSCPLASRPATCAAVATAPSALMTGASMQGEGPTTLQLLSLSVSGGLGRPASASRFAFFAARTSGLMRYPSGLVAQTTISWLPACGTGGTQAVLAPCAGWSDSAAARASAAIMLQH